MNNQIFTAINRLIKINRGHKYLIESQASEIGIHRTQHRILMYIARKGELPSQKTLAEHFEITPAAISGALQKLESDGYIERSLGTDSRFNQINITEKGREIVDKTRILFSRADDSLFLGFSEAEIEEFSAYLERIIVNLKGEDNDEKMV